MSLKVKIGLPATGPDCEDDCLDDQVEDVPFDAGTCLAFPFAVTAVVLERDRQSWGLEEMVNRPDLIRHLGRRRENEKNKFVYTKAQSRVIGQ